MMQPQNLVMLNIRNIKIQHRFRRSFGQPLQQRSSHLGRRFPPPQTMMIISAIAQTHRQR